MDGLHLSFCGLLIVVCVRLILSDDVGGGQCTRKVQTSFILDSIIIVCCRDNSTLFDSQRTGRRCLHQEVTVHGLRASGRLPTPEIRPAELPEAGAVQRKRHRTVRVLSPERWQLLVSVNWNCGRAESSL
jgi:hypothetical protein